MALNPIEPDSPFVDFFKNNLPSFYFEKFNTTDVARIEQFYSNIEVVFDNIYQRLKSFPDELDVRTAQAKNLYQLGKLIGIQDIDDLSRYLDDDGNVQGITQEDFDNALIRQRSYIANTIGRYLLKGTSESITRLLYSKGLDVELRELWTDESTTLGSSGNFFEYDNPLVTKYGDAIVGSISGDVYDEEAFDLISEISSTVPSASAIGDVSQYEVNNHGYYYALDDANNLYYKTSTSLEVTGAELETWYLFDDALTLSISGNIESFKLTSDKIYIKTDANNLEIFPYNLDDANIVSDFNVDDGDLYFFDFIENGARIFMDRGNSVEVRDSSTFQKISASVAKPIGNTETIFKIIKKKAEEYFILNTNSIGYILTITPENYGLFGSPDMYNMLIDLVNEAKYDLFRIEDDTAVVMKYNSVTNDITTSFLYFDGGNNMTLASSLITTTDVTNVNEFFQYSNRILLLDDNDFGLFNLDDRTYDEYAYVNGAGYTYDAMFFLDKFFLKRFDGGSNMDMSKILGWNAFKDALYKSHYFDILLQVGAIENIDITIAIDSLRDFVVSVIDTVKPAHTELLNILTLITAIETDELSIDDDDSTSPIASGGSTYGLIMTAKYDGQHPWKRADDHQLYYDNDGIDGRGILYYGETTFEFDAETTNDELDSLIYEND